MRGRAAGGLADADADARQRELQEVARRARDTVIALQTMSPIAIMVRRVPRSAQRAIGMPATV